MKIGSKYYCDDCEVEIPQFNSYGLKDCCDKCESFYQLSYDEQKEYHNLSDKEQNNIIIRRGYEPIRTFKQNS